MQHHQLPIKVHTQLYYHTAVVHTIACVAVHIIIVPTARLMIWFPNETFIKRFVSLTLSCIKKPKKFSGVRIDIVLFVGIRKTMPIHFPI